MDNVFILKVLMFFETVHLHNISNNIGQVWVSYLNSLVHYLSGNIIPPLLLKKIKIFSKCNQIRVQVIRSFHFTIPVIITMFLDKTKIFGVISFQVYYRENL